jgi:hypothetical protein
MALVLQIALVIIGAGGAVVTAATLTNPFWRRLGIWGFGALGVVSLVLTIITYGQASDPLPDIKAWVWRSAQDFWQLMLAIISSRLFQIPVAFIAGLALGAVGLFIYQNRPPKEWHTSYDILKLGNRELLRADGEAVAALNKIAYELEEATVARDKAKPTGDFWAMKVLTDPPQAYREAEEKRKELDLQYYKQATIRQQCFTAAINEMYGRLRNGSLIAKGLLEPVAINTEETEIPAVHWHFLKFNEVGTQATGEGITYKAISVASRT